MLELQFFPYYPKTEESNMPQIKTSEDRGIITYTHEDTDISRIILPTPFGVGPVNVYLIRQEGGTTLVDAGPNYGKAREQLTAGLSQLDVTQIDNLIVTHHHFDHSGLARFVVDEYDAKVLVHEQGVDYFTKGGRARKEEMHSHIFRDAGFPQRLVDFVARVFIGYERYGCEVEPKDLETAAESYVTQFKGEIVHCPGHSEDLIALRYGPFLICGDALWEGKTPNPFFSNGCEDRGLKAFLATLDKLYEMDFTIALAGHGNPIENHRKYINFVGEHHQRRAEEILGVLRAHGEITAFGLIKEIFGERLDNGDSTAADAYFLGLAEVVGNLERFTERNQVTSQTRGTTTFYRLNE